MYGTTYRGLLLREPYPTPLGHSKYECPKWGPRCLIWGIDEDKA